jgi:Protein of unknown function (DUF3106)
MMRLAALAFCLLLSQLAAALGWSSLTAAEKKVLAPLEAEWASYPKVQQEKWQRLAQRHPSMTAAEQARFNERMAGWNKLTPADRRAAREQFLEIKPNLPPQQRRETLQKQWDAYQQLPPEKQAEYRAKAEAKSASKAPPPAK